MWGLHPHDGTANPLSPSLEPRSRGMTSHHDVTAGSHVEKAGRWAGGRSGDKMHCRASSHDRLVVLEAGTRSLTASWQRSVVVRLQRDRKGSTALLHAVYHSINQSIKSTFHFKGRLRFSRRTHSGRSRPLTPDARNENATTRRTPPC